MFITLNKMSKKDVDNRVTTILNSNQILKVVFIINVKEKNKAFITYYDYQT